MRTSTTANFASSSMGSSMNSSSFSTNRKRNPRRIKFSEVYDHINQRYFFYTYLYSLFYLIGGGIGFSRTGNIYCIIMGLVVGFVLLLFAVGHSIDYYRGVQLEAVYVSVPLVISLFVAILMTCIYSLGSIFKFSLVIAIVGWISSVFYFYAVVKDYSHGHHSCENRFIEPQYDSLDLAQLLSKRDHNASHLSSGMTDLRGNSSTASEMQSSGLSSRKRMG